MNELDQFVKRRLQIPYYLRYADDFLFLDRDPDRLAALVPEIQDFLKSRLRLSLHPRKVILRKLRHGIDFLGYVQLPYHRVLRTRTKRRMLRRVSEVNLASYAGLLDHCNGYNLQQFILSKFHSPPFHSASGMDSMER